MFVHGQMAKLVRCIKNATFRRLEVVQEDIGLGVSPKGKGVDRCRILRKRKYAKPICFEETHQVADRPQPNAPELP